jgi:hypothetical protein
MHRVRLLKALFLVSKLGLASVKTTTEEGATTSAGNLIHEEFEKNVKICLQACASALPENQQMT